MTDWQERVMSGIAENQHPTTTRSSYGGACFESEFKGSLSPTRVHLDLAFVGLIDRAARTRDVNRSSYMRRAIAMMIAHDLGMDIRDVLWHSPAIGRHGKHQTNRGKRDRGEGIESWCAHPGCEGKHLTKN